MIIGVGPGAGGAIDTTAAAARAAGRTFGKFPAVAVRGVVVHPVGREGHQLVGGGLEIRGGAGHGVGGGGSCVVRPAYAVQMLVVVGLILVLLGGRRREAVVVL